MVQRLGEEMKSITIDMVWDALQDYYEVDGYNSVIEIFLQQEVDDMISDIVSALNNIPEE